MRSSFLGDSGSSSFFCGTAVVGAGFGTGVAATGPLTGDGDG